MHGLTSGLAVLLVLAAGSWLAMAVRVSRTGHGLVPPWKLWVLLEEYGALRDLGRVSSLWPALLFLAGIGLVVLAVVALLLV